MFGIIKKMFIGLLTDVVSASNHTKRVSLSNQNMGFNLHPNENSQEFHYYWFTVKLDKYVGSCNTLNDLSNKVCVPNKTEDLNLSVFNMITGINESKTLTKHVSCEYKCKFDGRNCNSDQWNGDKCWCKCKKRHVYEKGHVWNPATCNCENGKYLASIMDDSAIMCDEIIESYEEDAEAKLYDETNFNEKKQPVKSKISIFYFHFY